MSSHPIRIHNPQLSAAVALTQLLTLHPELPFADWSVAADGRGLSGSCWDAPAGTLEVFAEVLGGDLGDLWVNRKTGRQHRTLHAVFQDVQVLVTVYRAPVAPLGVAA